MRWMGLLLLFSGQVDIIPGTEYPRELQLAAVRATVRIVNVPEGTDGSGVILGRRDGALYILTAHHLVSKAERLEVSVFSVASYPKANKVYQSAEVAATSDDLTDLALVRLKTDDDAPGSLQLCPPDAPPPGHGFKGLAVGCGDDDAPTCHIDKILGKKLIRRQVSGKTRWFWEVDAKYAKGRSGGPLVGNNGYLIGILSGTSQGRSYFAHTEEIRAFLKASGFK